MKPKTYSLAILKKKRNVLILPETSSETTDWFTHASPWRVISFSVRSVSNPRPNSRTTCKSQIGRTTNDDWQFIRGLIYWNTTARIYHFFKSDYSFFEYNSVKPIFTHRDARFFYLDIMGKILFCIFLSGTIGGKTENFTVYDEQKLQSV